MPAINFTFISLGCSKNLVDTEELIGDLQANGFQIVPRTEDADLAIINTCAFLKEARVEALETINGLLKMKKNNKSRLKKVAVLGCLVQYTGEAGLKRRKPDIDLAVPLHAYPRLPELLHNLFFPFPGKITFRGQPKKKSSGGGKSVYRRFLSGSAHSVYLKIAEGCDNRCSYCLIPYLRGNLKSKRIEKIVEEARALMQMGAREINLVAQDTTAYGLDLYGAPGLKELLNELCVEMKNRGWIRILYTNPARLNKELLQLIAAEPAVCKYIDMPIQHASSRVLRKMGRRTTGEELSSIYRSIREIVPGAALRTTVMVGFPGEGEEEFEELLDFLRQHPFERLGVFRYSPEKGTPAFHFTGHVSPAAASERLDKVMSLQREVSRSYHRTLLGHEATMLVDGCDERRGKIYGRLYSQAPEVDGRVIARAEQPAFPGDYLRIKITGVGDYDLVGERVLHEPGQ